MHQFPMQGSPRQGGLARAGAGITLGGGGAPLLIQPQPSPCKPPSPLPIQYSLCYHYLPSAQSIRELSMACACIIQYSLCSAQLLGFGFSEISTVFSFMLLFHCVNYIKFACKQTNSRTTKQPKFDQRRLVACQRVGVLCSWTSLFQQTLALHNFEFMVASRAKREQNRSSISATPPAGRLLEEL